MSYMKNLGTAAKGNDRLLKKYGGSDGSSPMARQKYAKGGAVMGGNPSLDEGLSSAADGAPSKPSLARPGRKMAGKGKGDKKGTHVNVVIMQQPGKGGADAGPMPAGGPGPMPPMPPPGGPPGGPPMPMRANGGRIANLGKFAWGGKVKGKDMGDRQKVTTKGDEAAKIAEKEESDGDKDDYAKGGKVCKDGGGPVGLHMKGKTVGAGGGLGRLAKVKMYGK